MPNDEEAVAASKKLSDPEWARLAATAAAYARTKVAGGRPCRKMAPGHPLWDDLVNEFIAAAAVVEGGGGPKDAEELSARRYAAGKAAADRFFNRQFRLPARHEVGFSDSRAKAFLHVPDRDDDGEEWAGDPADNVIGDSGDLLGGLARREMVKFIREAIDNLSPALKQAVRLAGGLGESPELDGYEPREPNKDGSGGARGMLNVEVGPAVGVSPRHAGNLLRKAKSEILEVLLKKHKFTVADIEEYFPGFTLED